MRPLEGYFRRVSFQDDVQGGPGRDWPVTVFSSKTRNLVNEGKPTGLASFDEWSMFS